MTTPTGFVGRGQELDALAARLKPDGPGSGGVLVVSGPAGIGKSTLVESALRRAAPTAVVRGYCPAEPAPPLWPWQAALRRGGSDTETLSEVEPAAAASARFVALARLSESVLASGPLVIVLEDLHWADTATLDLLSQVAAGAVMAGVTVIGTVRTPAPEPVALSLAGLSRYGAHTLPLLPFTAAEVAELVDPDRAGDVFLRTGGLPLLVAAVRAGYGSTDLPTVVRTLLGGLDPADRAVIEAAAVLGENIDERLLSAMLGSGAPDALTAAWHNGLLTAADDGTGYRFAHSLVRDGIVALLAPPELRRLNRLAAEALAGAEPDQAARVAMHLRLAGRKSDGRVEAARWSRTAARQARMSHAYADAVYHLTLALDDLPIVDTEERADVLLELAEAEHLAGRYDRCLDWCVEAADMASRLGRADLVAASALVLQYVTYNEAGTVVSGLCERALAYDLSDADRARVLAQLAVMTANAGRVADAVAPTRESLALAMASGDVRAEIEAARAREMTLVQPEDATERLRLGELVSARAEAIGQPLAAIVGHGWRIQSAYMLADLDTVESASAAVERLARRSPLPLAQWHRHRLIASRTTLTGQFTESAEHSRKATAIAQASGDATAEAMFFAHGAFVAALRGHPDALPDGIQAALAFAPPQPLVDLSRANMLIATGALTEAREVYDRLRAAVPVPADHPAWAAVLIEMVRSIELFEDVETASLVYQQLSPFRSFPGALGAPTVYFTGTVSRYLGQLAAVFGDAPLAVELLREALVRNRVLGARPDLVLTGISLASVLSTQGGTGLDEAAQLAQSAVELAARLDMPGPLARAGRLVATIASQRNSADPLTSREREVARLLADALTNRQIAAKLVLSERTVESHVRSILAKTQCANRTDFVRRFADQ